MATAQRNGHESKHSTNNYSTYRLSSPLNEVQPEYDVVVVGSGYGGSIAASRCARAGQTVCLLERGKEWWPGDFPESELRCLSELQVTSPGRKKPHGNENGLFDFVLGTDVSVLQGCGLGGTSLINANVALDCDRRVFKDQRWPEKLRQDFRTMYREDRQHVFDMLKPREYPDNFPELPKLKAMEKGAADVILDIEDLYVQDVFRKAPLYVNFEDLEKNEFGIPQPACNGCGNCCSGCNTGAKNTLNFNYLPDAKAFGADIFTQVKVSAVLRDEATDLWNVYYVEMVQDAFRMFEQVVRAKTVILGAGSLGSTNILMKSADRGLNVSSRLGERFTTNGDALNFSYNTAHKIRCVGCKSSEAKAGNGPGPAITGVIDMRGVPGAPMEDGYVLEDGTPPVGWETPLNLVLKTTPGLKLSHGHNAREAMRALTGKALKNTLSVLSMSHDSSDGKLVLDKSSGRVWPDFPRVGLGDNFQKIYEGSKRLTAALEGHHIANPIWKGAMAHLRHTKSVITVHPLGGCGMGESGKTGVVNHAGQVFIGDTDEVYPGLMVVDGAVMPRSLGVNPTLTIAMVAERCIRLLAARNRWKIEFPARRNIATVCKKTKPGFRFTEKMGGKVIIGGNKQPLTFKLTIESRDIYNMLIVDPHHRAGIHGIVTCEALSKTPLTVSNGVFELFSQSEERVETKLMVYDMTLNSLNGDVFHFRGEKCVHKNNSLAVGVSDTTHMTFVVRKGSDGSGEKVGEGKLKLKLLNFLRQLTTMEVTNCNSKSEKLKWKTKFCTFFAGALWEVYGILSPSTAPFNPDAPPRERRSIMADATEEMMQIIAKDGVPLVLTRHKGGQKGPILLLHGLGVSSRIFSLDTIDTNLVEYLVQRGYDVWLLDMRFSISLPAHREKYTIVDAAEFDIPVAIDHIIDTTGVSNIQLLAHGVGCLAVFTSLLIGYVAKEKVRTIVASQLGFFFKPTSSSSTRPNFLGEGIDAYTDTNENWMGRVFNALSDRYASFATAAREHCDSSVCHRVTFLYRPSWQHENLNKSTHDTLHEWNGFTNKALFQHLYKCALKKQVCNRDGNPLIPNWNAKDYLQSEEYRSAMNRLDVPIFFFIGSENSRWDKQTVKRSSERCYEMNPRQNYMWYEVPKYNHLDPIVGKNAHHDVFPYFLPFLEKFSAQS